MESSHDLDSHATFVHQGIVGRGEDSHSTWKQMLLRIT
jgi:hypothetical protein